jgi:hypothetical protein
MRSAGYGLSPFGGLNLARNLVLAGIFRNPQMRLPQGRSKSAPHVTLKLRAIVPLHAKGPVLEVYL